MTEKTWEILRNFYKDNFGINPDVVDLVASNDILLMSVSGSSNHSISVMLDVDESVIVDVLRTVLDFDGWGDDLLTNPYYTFSYLCNMGKTLFKDFRNEVVSTFGTTVKDADIQTMFRVCRTYDKISERLEREWV